MLTNFYIFWFFRPKKKREKWRKSLTLLALHIMSTVIQTRNKRFQPLQTVICHVGKLLARNEKWGSQKYWVNFKRTNFILRNNLWHSLQWQPSLYWKRIENQGRTEEEKKRKCSPPQSGSPSVKIWGPGGLGWGQGGGGVVGEGVHATCLMTSYCLHPSPTRAAYFLQINYLPWFHSSKLLRILLQLHPNGFLHHSASFNLMWCAKLSESYTFHKIGNNQIFGVLGRCLHNSQRSNLSRICGIFVKVFATSLKLWGKDHTRCLALWLRPQSPLSANIRVIIIIICAIIIFIITCLPKPSKPALKNLGSQQLLNVPIQVMSIFLKRGIKVFPFYWIYSRQLCQLNF